jgi:hypothetical protein
MRGKYLVSTAFACLVLTNLILAQNLDHIRTDRLQNVGQFGIGTNLFNCAHPALVHFVHPPQGQPSYVYGYVQTCPTIGGRTQIFGSAVYNRMFFQNANLPMSYFGNANNHEFQKAPFGTFRLVGPAQFCASYGSTGLVQRDVVFPNGPPSARLRGPTADLTAVLLQNRLGPLNTARFRVTGFFIDQNGINNVNLITPIGGITFNTELQVAPNISSMPLVNLRVPRGIVNEAPRVPTTVAFKALYSLQLQP